MDLNTVSDARYGEISGTPVVSKGVVISDLAPGNVPKTTGAGPSPAGRLVWSPRRSLEAGSPAVYLRNESHSTLIDHNAFPVGNPARGNPWPLSALA